MTFFQRAAVCAALSLGIVGMAGTSVPGQAAETVNDAIVAQISFPQLFNLPATGQRIALPTVAATVQTDDAVSDDQAPTAIDTIDPVAPTFQSLAAAVAAQDAPGDLSAELRCLAGAVFYESKGEPLAGQLAVAEVIINRARSGRFARSLCGVVTQAGQFSFVRGGAIPAINPALRDWKTALAVAQVALEDAWASPAADAMFFHARRVSPGWGKPRLASIGNHVFYR
ncbi:MAG: cell wall hydrolase [Pseudomonadota bacterium]